MATGLYMIWPLSHFLLLLLLFTLLQPQWPPFFIMNMLSLLPSQGCPSAWNGLLLALAWLTSPISLSSNTTSSWVHFLTTQSKVAFSFMLDPLILSDFCPCTYHHLKVYYIFLYEIACLPNRFSASWELGPCPSCLLLYLQGLRQGLALLKNYLLNKWMSGTKTVLKIISQISGKIGGSSWKYNDSSIR